MLRGGAGNVADRDLGAFVEALFEAPVGIAFVDRQLRYLRCNGALAAFHGLASEQHVGRAVDELQAQTSLPTGAVVRQVLANGEPLVEEKLVAGRAFLVSYAPVRADGAIIGVDVVAVEITQTLDAVASADAERAQLLDHAEQARAEAEAANRSKDDFLATLSHELRTPLNAILGWAQLVRAGKLDLNEQARALEVIERNARAQAQLVEDILDISRIIAGKLRLQLAMVDVRAFVESALDDVRPTAEARRVALELTVDDAVETVRGDFQRLEQVVWNLLSNAIKFTPAGGHVRVSVTSKDGNVVVEVRDDGKGIPPNFLPLVFERYRQADGAITRAHGGLGLGLAIVRHLVQMHGGTVSAHSDGEGQGATFAFTLPLDAGPREPIDFVSDAAATVVELPPSLEQLRILVVDDEPDARELMTVLLEQHGAEVMAVGDVPSALSAYQSFRPNLLVSDIGLPGEDGYALLQKLRALAGRELCAVALTAFAGEEHSRRALDAGFQMHVPKPVEPEALLAVISRVSGWVPSKR